MVKSRSFAVVDASYIIAFLLPDEWTKSVQRVFHDYKKGQLFLTAPSILSYEVLNGLKMAVKRRRLNRERGNVLVQDFSALQIIEESIEVLQVYRTAMDNNLTAYDASYLWLAKNKGVALYSLDKKLVSLSKK